MKLLYLALAAGAAAGGAASPWNPTWRPTSSAMVQPQISGSLLRLRRRGICFSPQALLPFAQWSGSYFFWLREGRYEINQI